MKRLLVLAVLSLLFAACSSLDAAPSEPELETLSHTGNLRVVVSSPRPVPSYPGIVVRDSRGRYVASVNRTTTLTNLEHGNYRVTASSFDIGGLCKPVWKVYVPSPRTQVRHVPVGRTATASVTFTEYDLGGNDDFCPKPPGPPGDPEPPPGPFF